jgi:hypothetical protein
MQSTAAGLRSSLPERDRYGPAGLRAVSKDGGVCDPPLPRTKATVMKPAAATVNSTAIAISRAQRQARREEAGPERFSIAK